MIIAPLQVQLFKPGAGLGSDGSLQGTADHSGKRKRKRGGEKSRRRCCPKTIQHSSPGSGLLVEGDAMLSMCRLLEFLIVWCTPLYKSVLQLTECIG